ncbi:sensor histidine kinase [Krasilnikovia sp. M28-CT-15]|uniref:sensor histidine kinase n=1 Tax=Krasilnikovia sp. M28-CT-15 TaxID=3373540 RepID=UPI0038766DAC
MAYSLLASLRLPAAAGMVFDHSDLRWLVLGGATALTLAGVAALVRRPVLAAVLLLAGGVCGAAMGAPADLPLAQFLAFDVALGCIAAAHPRRTAIVSAIVAAGLFLGYQGIRLVTGWGVAVTETVLLTFAAVVAWLIGRSVYDRREHAAALRARATTDAINVERLRIGRELHDMVAHNIGIVALQAGSANLVIDTQPAVVRQALLSIESASRETLAGLRRMLVALREADPEQSAPTPGLCDVQRLATATSDAGLAVDLRWAGERRTLPPEVEVSAYRIIQEAVTNVARHSDARSCQVSIDYQDDELVIEVLDAGTGVGRGTGGGYGLIGMRERVNLLHGDFSAAPRPEGGFRVAARLPTLASAP